MRVLFTSVALAGHFFPLVPLAWACRSMGHDVLVATSENFLPAVLRSGLPAISCGPSIDFRGFITGGDQAARETGRYANGRFFGRVAAGNLPGVRALVEAWRPDLVVSERAECAGPIAAQACGVPAVELQWGVAPLGEYRAAATGELDRDLAELGMAELPGPAMVLNPWPPSLRLAHAAGHHPMRNAPYDGDTLVPDWVLRPHQRPRICFTLGTVLPRFGRDGMSEVMVPILMNLARLGVDVVVAVEDKLAAGWPPLPEAVRHVGRMPLSQILPACDVAIHHGGHGTSLTALGAGKPQLVLPAFDDQFDNAQAVVRAGAGLSLRPSALTPAAVADSCLELLDEARFGHSAAAVAAEIEAAPSLVDVVGTLAELAGGAPARPRVRAA